MELTTLTCAEDSLALEAEISKTQNVLAELSKRRDALQLQGNYNQKPFINRLPVETISEIFLKTFLHRTYDCRQLTFGEPLHLAAVCQMWRNVAFGTPQLWSYINISVKSGKKVYRTDVVKEWLSRSRSLPLSMKIKLLDCHKLCSLDNICDEPSLFEIIRSHSTRWHSIEVEASCSFLLHSLFNGLKNSPIDLQFLDVGWCSKDPVTFDAGNVLFPRSIYQSEPRMNGAVGLWDLPCGFERLTHIYLTNVPIDEVMYFFAHASNLIQCEIPILGDETGEEDVTFPLPITPIVAQHLVRLVIKLSSLDSFFPYLTLPSLSSLNLEYWNMSCIENFMDLATCIERSSPTLSEFTCTIDLGRYNANGWWDLLPGITSLTLNHSNNRIIPEIPRRCVSTEEFLAALASRSNSPVVLPNLTKLLLITRGMSEVSWTSLCDIVQHRERLESTEIQITERWKRDFDMEHTMFHRLVSLRKKVKVSYFEGPKFGSYGALD